MATSSNSSSTLQLTLVSAKHLHNVNFFTKMSVYAVANTTSNPSNPQRTQTDHHCHKKPSWNSTLFFSIPSAPTDVLRIRIISERRLGDRQIGEVHIPVKELLEAPADPTGKPQFVSYQVRKSNSRKAKGVLNISYRFLDVAMPPKATDFSSPSPSVLPSSKKEESVSSHSAYPTQENPKNGEPVTAATYYGPPAGYPYYQSQINNYSHAVHPPAPGYGYPPPPAYGYLPPPASYAYPQPPTGYGYGAGAAAPQKKNNGFGMGMGAGLIGGAIGGLLIGDMVSDAAGFDGGGFDF